MKSNYFFKHRRLRRLNSVTKNSLKIMYASLKKSFYVIPKDIEKIIFWTIPRTEKKIEIELSRLEAEVIWQYAKHVYPPTCSLFGINPSLVGIFIWDQKYDETIKQISNFILNIGPKANQCLHVEVCKILNEIWSYIRVSAVLWLVAGPYTIIWLSSMSFELNYTPKSGANCVVRRQKRRVMKRPEQ